MQAVNFFFVNALLFSSLIAVIGVPVLYVTQPSTEEGQKENRRKIYSIAAVWVVLVFVTGIVSSLVWSNTLYVRVYIIYAKIKWQFMRDLLLMLHL